MKKTIEERKEYAKIIAQAWKDEEFKAKLLADPTTVLKENGIEIPEGMTVKVVEQKENEILVPIPPRPRESGELSDENLGKVAGGISPTVIGIGFIAAGIYKVHQHRSGPGA